MNRHGGYASSQEIEREKKQTHKERVVLRKDLARVVRNVEYVLWFELGLAIVWIVLMLLALFIATRDLIFLVVSSFHSAATLAAIICLEFFIYKDEPMSTFTNLLWQVPAAIALATDVIISASAFKSTLLPLLQGNTAPDDPPLWLAWSIFLFTLTLIVTSIIYLALFFRIGTLTRSIQSSKKYLPV